MGLVRGKGKGISTGSISGRRHSKQCFKSIKYPAHLQKFTWLPPTLPQPGGALRTCSAAGHSWMPGQGPAPPGACPSLLWPSWSRVCPCPAGRKGTLSPSVLSPRCWHPRAAPGHSRGARWRSILPSLPVSPVSPSSSDSKGSGALQAALPQAEPPTPGTRGQPAPRAENSTQLLPRVRCSSGWPNTNLSLSPREKGTPKGSPGRRSQAAHSLLNIVLPREHQEKNKISARGRGEGRTKTPSAY